MRIFLCFIITLSISTAAISQNVGINKVLSEHTLDVRSTSIKDHAELNVSNQDKSRYLRLFSGSSMFPDPAIIWEPTKNLGFATYDDMASTFTEYMRISNSGNVGIGTTNPQNKLHVAGGLRIEDLAGTYGLVINNNSGDLSSTLAYTGNSADVLRGNFTFGPVTGLTPSSGVITSKVYNNTSLINAGYSLVGEIPQVLTYSTTSATFLANSWQPTYTRGVPTKLSAPVYGNSGEAPIAAWTGSQMYVVNNDGTYSYNPGTDSWALLTPNFTGGSVGDRMVWTGTEIILWKGQSTMGQKYNPSTNTITNISTTNAPTSRYDHTMTWDGTRAIVWGGVSAGTSINTGAMYDPVANTWTVMGAAGAPAARQKHTAIWCSTVNRLIVWGGSTSAFSGHMNTGARFDPASNTWTGATNTVSAPGVRNLHTSVWAGTEMIVYGGQIGGGTSLNTGGRYNPSTNTWGTATSTTGAPLSTSHAAVWTGTEMYISGGYYAGGNGSSYLYKYNPMLNTWAFAAFFIGADQVGEGKYLHHCFYKSNMLLVWGGKKSSLEYRNTGFRYFLSNTASSATTLTSETLYLYEKN